MFAPLGHFKLSAEPAPAEVLFRSGAAAFGAGRPGAFAVRRPERTFAWLYAWAMTLASALVIQEQAAAEWDPRRTYNLIGVNERERGVIPRAGWSIRQRREQLQRARRLIMNVARAGVENELRDLLGDDFRSYRPTPKAEIVNWPVNLSDQPMYLSRPDVPRKVAYLTSPVVTLGSSQIVTIDEHTPSIEWRIMERDVIIIEPDNDARAERVFVEAAGDSDGGPPYTLQITPTKPHPAGSIVYRGPWPLWTGSKRHSLVVLSAAGAADLETRRAANLRMETLARGVSTWDLAGANADDATKAGPFRVGVGLIGSTPIGEVSL